MKGYSCLVINVNYLGLDEVDGDELSAASIISYGSETKTPFVNREREIVELALHNAKLIDIMKKNKGEVDDRRGIYFVFAAQMYGAGKTRLGQEFVTQLPKLISEKRHVFEKYWRGKIGPLKDLMDILVQFADAKFAQIVLHDSAAIFASFLADMQVNDFTEFLCDICDIAECPVFIHIDELGCLPAKELRVMRDACYKCVVSLGKSGNLKSSFPFFYFSGRGAPYDELGSSSSPIASHWLILEPLKIEHVQILMQNSTFTPSLLKFSFQRNLPSEELLSIL